MRRALQQKKLSVQIRGEKSHSYGVLVSWLLWLELGPSRGTPGDAAKEFWG